MRAIRLSSIFWLILLACGQQGQAADVALYSDHGAAKSCLTATKNMFEWMGLDVVQIDAGYINSRSLDGFQIICFPGGDMYQYAQDISESGKSKIRAFIGNGGGYIGICGGAYFTGERVYWQGTQLPMSPLAIFPGTTMGPIDAIAPYPNCVMCMVNITDRDHPITQIEPDTTWIMYCYGPKLLPDDQGNVRVLGSYDIGGEPAMVAFQYGEGRVFIIGTHPEFEEDSERDGVSFGDDLDDRGSDWDLMQRAVHWCSGESID